MIRPGLVGPHFEEASVPIAAHDWRLEAVGNGFDFRALQLGVAVMQLINATAEFRMQAISHRGFLVGAGASVVRGRRFGRVLGHNIKPYEDDSVNIHAEDVVEHKTSVLDFSLMSVVAVVGWPQPDKITGKTRLTLGPCGQRCRPLFAISKYIDTNTLFVSATPDFKTFQFSNILGLIKADEYDDDSGVTTFQFEETPSVFQPLPPVRRHGAYSVEDADIDTTDWDSTVDLWLSQRYASLYGPQALNREKYEAMLDQSPVDVPLMSQFSQRR